MKHLLLSALLALFFVEVFSVFPYRSSTASVADSPNYVSGLINVHSKLSDGSVAIPELAQLAKASGHSFVVFADYNSTEGRKLGFEKTYEGLDAFIELETSTPSGDLLAFFSHTDLASATADEISKLAYNKFLGSYKGAGLFVSISHPSHIKRPWAQLDRFPDGMEIINFDSIFWRKLYSNPLDFFGLAAIYPLNPFVAWLRMNMPYPKDVSNWDNMNSVDPGHFGILSSQFKHKIHLSGLGIFWPEYEEIFRMGSNIVLLKEPLSPDFLTRKTQIYQSIKNGRLAMVFQTIHPFSGNDFYLKCPQGLYRSGDTVQEAGSNCEFIVKTPRAISYSTKILLFRNGELQKEISSSESEVHIPLMGAGQFRVEIMARPHTAFWILLRKWVPYVIYNPIFVS